MTNPKRVTIERSSLAILQKALVQAGAVVHVVGPRVGVFTGESGDKIEADRSMENSPSVLFDALILPDGDAAVAAVAAHRHLTRDIDPPSK